MLYNAHHHKKPSYRGVLMDTWYASKNLMLTIEGYGKIYYCPLKTNRLVDDSKKPLPYRPVGKLSWTQTELKEGNLSRSRTFPKITKSSCSAFLFLPSGRILSSPTIRLVQPRTMHETSTPSVGRSSNFIARSNKPAVLSAANAVSVASRETTSLVPSSFGIGSSLYREKPTPQSIK